nr:MarR family winged helix-turn-helix transcriptional regulator [Kineococcus vitellinus]
MSPSQLRLLGIIPERGARMTDLAARASITKQSLGELVSALRASGHLETVPDAQDGRVKFVRPTAEGRRVRHRIDEEIAALEAAYAQQLGTRRFATLLAALRELGAAR